MRLDFIGATFKGRSVSVDSQECVNFYPEISPNQNSKSDMILIGTPGKKLFVNIGYGTIRGMYTTIDNRLFVVTGKRLYEVFGNKNNNYIGDLDTKTGPVGIAENETQLMICDGIAGYLYYTNSGVKPAGTFEKILSSDYRNGSSIVNIDRYFIQNVSEEGYFIVSNIGDGSTWDLLSYAYAERSPDKILTIGSVNNELWVFGTRTIEVWYNSGASDFPFSRINNAFINIGLGAKNSVGVINNSVLWIGGNDQGNNVVWMATGYIPKRVSNNAIEYLISSLGNISDAKAWVYQQEGHLFYVLNFSSANKTLCYDLTTDLWHERGYLNKKTGLNDRDIAGYHTFFNGKNYVSDYRNSKIYELNLDYYFDDENLIKRIRTGGHIHSDRKRLFFSRFDLDIQRGVGTPAKGILTKD
jgi:hypothetical protein